MILERVANGFLVSVPNDLDDGYIQYVFQMSDNPKNVDRSANGEDLDTWYHLLYFVMEQSGYFPSRRDEKRIDIRILTKDDVEVSCETE